MALFAEYIVIDGLKMREEIRSTSKFFKTLHECRRKWPRHWLFFKRPVHEVRFGKGPVPSLTNDGKVEAFARAAISTGKRYRSFVGPLAYDLDDDVWVFAFSDKSDAMLFKLEYA